MQAGREHMTVHGERKAIELLQDTVKELIQDEGLGWQDGSVCEGACSQTR